MDIMYRLGDKVTFNVGKDSVEYEITDIYLNNVSYGNNDKIFKLLGIDKEEFCSKAYGYSHMGGNFPEYKPCDLHAVGRVIEALHE